MLARSGLIGCPCPVPVSVTSNLPSSMTPTLIHLPIMRSTLPSVTRSSIMSTRADLTIEWWVGTGLEVDLLCPSPLAEPVEQISRNGLPRLHSLDSRHTVGWSVETAYGSWNQG